MPTRRRHGTPANTVALAFGLTAICVIGAIVLAGMGKTVPENLCRGLRLTHWRRRHRRASHSNATRSLNVTWIAVVAVGLPISISLVGVAWRLGGT